MQYVQAQPAVQPQPVQMTMANGSTFIKGADGEYKVVIGRTPPPMAGSAGPMQGSAPPQPVVATTIAGQQMQMMPVGGMALSFPTAPAGARLAPQAALRALTRRRVSGISPRTFQAPRYESSSTGPVIPGHLRRRSTAHHKLQGLLGAPASASMNTNTIPTYLLTLHLCAGCSTDTCAIILFIPSRRWLLCSQ